VGITHNKVVTKPQNSAFEVSKDEWNDGHNIGTLTIELIHLVQSVQDLINNALNITTHDTTDRHTLGSVVPHDTTKFDKSGGIITGDTTIERAADTHLTIQKTGQTGLQLGGVNGYGTIVPVNGHVLLDSLYWYFILTGQGMIPYYDAAYDLGTSSARFRDIYASRNVLISTAPTADTHATNKTYVDGKKLLLLGLTDVSSSRAFGEIYQNGSNLRVLQVTAEDNPGMSLWLGPASPPANWMGEIYWGGTLIIPPNYYYKIQSAGQIGSWWEMDLNVG